MTMMMTMLDRAVHKKYTRLFRQDVALCMSTSKLRRKKTHPKNLAVHTSAGQNNVSSKYLNVFISHRSNIRPEARSIIRSKQIRIRGFWLPHHVLSGY